jgi:hypothetical protein
VRCCCRPVIRFRNYQPKSEALAKAVVPKPPLPSVEVARVLQATTQPAAASIALVPAGAPADAAKSAEVEVVAIAPKKANWDLKRDADKRLQKLERQTQAAIRELVRECTCSCRDRGTVWVPHAAGAEQTAVRAGPAVLSRLSRRACASRSRVCVRVRVSARVCRAKDCRGRR